MEKKVRVVTLDVEVSHYDPHDCSKSSMTVGELIEELECFNEQDKIILRFSNGYSYGAIYEENLRERNVEVSTENEIYGY